MAEAHANSVANNLERRRYELNEQGQIAFAEYWRHDDPDGSAVINIHHVETPVVLRGTGVAGRLMEGVLAHAQADGLKIIPSCSYAAAWFVRHPAARDMLA